MGQAMGMEKRLVSRSEQEARLAQERRNREFAGPVVVLVAAYLLVVVMGLVQEWKLVQESKADRVTEQE